jgi:PPK2 family polyphosphate:nucleotide phosphotransferase
VTESIRERLVARQERASLLPDPRSTPGVKGRKRAERETVQGAERLGKLQERLWAERRRSVLLVLQGMDTSGKNGAIKHVFRGLNPVGIDVASFERPTDEELAHHFLWRIERRLPRPGQITIFNRSHYEDVLVVRVMGLVPEEEWRGRYAEILDFERRIAESGTTIIKVYLHISFEEQRQRLLARLDDPDKHWKFDEADLEQRGRWDDYMAAYEAAIRECHTDAAPWYLVPSDRKWYRNRAIAGILEETLVEMDPRFPHPDLDVARLRVRLAPPNRGADDRNP